MHSNKEWKLWHQTSGILPCTQLNSQHKLHTAERRHQEKKRINEINRTFDQHCSAFKWWNSELRATEKKLLDFFLPTKPPWISLMKSPVLYLRHNWSSHEQRQMEGESTYLCVLCEVNLHGGQHIGSAISSELGLRSIKFNGPAALQKCTCKHTRAHQHKSVFLH